LLVTDREQQLVIRIADAIRRIAEKHIRERRVLGVIEALASLLVLEEVQVALSSEKEA
jgi:hypothetical protein